MLEQFHCDLTNPVFVVAPNVDDSYGLSGSAYSRAEGDPAVVPFSFDSMDCYATATSSASSSVSSINGFTYGEALNATLLLIIAAMIFFKMIMDRAIGVRSQNTKNY